MYIQLVFCPIVIRGVCETVSASLRTSERLQSVNISLEVGRLNQLSLRASFG